MKHAYAIVIYKTECLESKSINTLIELIKKNVFYSKIIVYDNSPNLNNKTFCKKYGFNYLSIEYENSLREAYSNIFSFARLNGIDWITLLDQDSEVTIKFHECILNDIELNPNIYIKVPYVISKLNLISPCNEYLGGYLKGIKFSEKIKKINKSKFAIGSFSTLKTDLNRFLDFKSSPFKIDCLDRWMYEKLKENKVEMNIIPVRVNHELSVLTDNFVKLERYNSIVASEFLFIKLYRHSICNYIFYYLRVIVRILKLLIRKNVGISYIKIIFNLYLK
jgi:hypothetical protein